ncbi:MAG: HAD family hydrolase [Clostridiales bacterium]|nr:HAD family hydrolase [Clostridiales bacterium]
MMKKYDFIIFDLDGTIIDPSIGITNSILYSSKKLGVEPRSREDLLKFIGPPLIDSFKKFFGFSEERAKIAIKYYREYFKDKGVLECSLYDGIEDILKALKQKGKRLAVATTKPEIFAIEVLEHFNLDSYFEFVAGSNLDGTRVDKGELITYALESCGIRNLNEAIIIGDRKHDILGGKKVGIDSMGILYGFGDREEFEDAGATYIADSPRGILEFLI